MGFTGHRAVGVVSVHESNFYPIPVVATLLLLLLVDFSSIYIMLGTAQRAQDQKVDDCPHAAMCACVRTRERVCVGVRTCATAGTCSEVLCRAGSTYFIKTAVSCCNFLKLLYETKL